MSVEFIQIVHKNMGLLNFSVKKKLKNNTFNKITLLVIDIPGIDFASPPKGYVNANIDILFSPL